MEENFIKPKKEYRFDIENAEITLFCNVLSPRSKYVPLYSHPYYVIIFVINGSALIPIEGGEEISLASGEAVIVPKDVKHMLKLTSPDTYSVAVAFGFDKTSHYSTNNLYGTLEKLFAGDSIKLKKDSRAITLVDKCFTEAEHGNKYAVGAAFYELVVELMRYRQVIPVDAFHSSSTDDNTARIHRINTLANAYYDKNISVDDLAEMLYLSPRQVNRIIESHFGTTWSALITARRMKVARDLIERGEMPIDEIAEYVGYNSTRGFRSAYTKYFGETPRRH